MLFLLSTVQWMNKYYGAAAWGGKTVSCHISYIETQYWERAMNVYGFHP
ncbi:hypothetical protein SXCC_02837 [Gluconacetobacter sp. SXCC-1]|nr:hypothetical protein SXCC_02837 [Gluconacetobacter sp. SXCC-1]